ncbi:MAG: AtpZ/AtpI family protein [Elusimicrobiaceae bacterium]|nr:AtpZ/AtpI family protein [Elusimicrobiaceae bacterium]
MSLKDFSAKDHVAITTLGLEFAAAEMLGAGVGFWLDKKYQSSPWFLLAGAVVGFMLGMYIVWRRTKEMERDEKKNERR